MSIRPANRHRHSEWGKPSQHALPNAARNRYKVTPRAVRTISKPMTYCCGILVSTGLVMIADTRTNAGLDNVSTFRKLHIYTQPGDRIMAIASAGNLAISQSVLSTLT